MAGAPPAQVVVERHDLIPKNKGCGILSADSGIAARHCMSAILPEADIRERQWRVSFGPLTDIVLPGVS
jgi:hypothetical protein